MPWKCIVCGCAAVEEADPQAVALLRAQRRAGDGRCTSMRRTSRQARARPRARRRRASTRAACGRRELARPAPVEVAHEVRVKAVSLVVDLAPAKAGVPAVACARRRGRRTIPAMSCGSAAPRGAVRVRDRRMRRDRPEPEGGGHPRSLRRVSGATKEIMACLNLSRGPSCPFHSAVIPRAAPDVRARQASPAACHSSSQARNPSRSLGSFASKSWYCDSTKEPSSFGGPC